jgi:hypothetical protein
LRSNQVCGEKDNPNSNYPFYPSLLHKKVLLNQGADRQRFGLTERFGWNLIEFKKTACNLPANRR